MAFGIQGFGLSGVAGVLEATIPCLVAVTEIHDILTGTFIQVFFSFIGGFMGLIRNRLDLKPWKEARWDV